jgi:serine/threonine protein kinase
VLDFGIADDERMGTPAYLPPENDLSPSADVFALGVVWFEAVKGRRPEPGETLGGLQERCVAPSAAARPTAAEIATALGIPAGSGQEIEGGEQAAAYEAAAAYRAAAPAPSPPRPRTRTLTTTTTSYGPHGRLLLVAGGTTAAAAVALGLLLSGAAFRPAAAPVSSPSSRAPSPATLSATPERPVTHTSPPAHRQRSRPAATRTSPTAVPPAPNATPPGAIDALSRMRRTVDEGLAASEVRADVAVDLDNVISNLLNELAAGAHVNVNQRVSELRTKIAQRTREGGLAPTRASQLTRTLAAL